MATVKDTKKLIDAFLQPVRGQMNKQASESTSFKDTAAATPQSQAKPFTGATTQQTLGKEQATAAADSNSNVASVAPNSDEDDKQYADTAGTKTLTTDDPVTEGNIGPMRHQTISQEQKVARAERMAHTILNVLEQAVGGIQQKQAAAQVPLTPEEQEAAALYNHFHKLAAEAAADVYDGFMMGLFKRAQDEHELHQAQIPAHILEKVGGVSGLLDKVAAEDIGAVLPEGMALPADMGGEAPVDPAAGAVDPAAAGGEPNMEELAVALDEAGVSPEDVQAAFEDLAALQEAGVAPEEIAAALEELSAEGGEAPAAEAAPVEKTAAARNRRDLIKQFIKA